MNFKAHLNLILLAFFLLIFTLFLKGSALAKIVTAEENLSIAQSEIIDEDLFVGAGNVILEGVVNGNLFVAGGQVKIAGRVNGSVFVVGGMVEVSGNVSGNLVAGAGSVNLTSAEINNGLIIGAGSLTVDAESKIGGGVVAGVGTLNLNAPVGKGILAGAGLATLNSVVKKDVQLSVGQLVLGEKANLEENLIYTADQEAQIDKSAKIAGQTTYTPTPETKIEIGQGFLSNFKKLGLAFSFVSYFATLLLGTIILYLFPTTSQKVAQTILEKPWQSLGVGFLILVLTLPAVFLLTITMIGFPLAALGFVFWLISMYVAKIFVGLLFGQSLLEAVGKREVNRYLVLALGLLVYFILTAIPVLGWFITLATITFGLGALFLCEREFLLQGR